MKKLLIGLGVVVVLLIAVGVVISLIPLDSYQGEIQARVKEATGRDLRIDGAISLSLFPPVAVSVEDVAFANAPAAASPEMATTTRPAVALSGIGRASERERVWRHVQITRASATLTQKTQIETTGWDI